MSQLHYWNWQGYELPFESSLKSYLMTFFDISALIDVFKWYAKFDIFVESLLRCFVDNIISLRENRRFICSKLAVDDKSLLRSFMYIKRKRGPNIGLSCTPAKARDQEEVFSFNRILWNLPVKNFSIIFSNEPDIPKHWNIHETFMPNFIKTFRCI